MNDSLGFLNALNHAGPKPKEILVTFAGGQQATYTVAILELLKSDPSVVEIMDMETGELLYSVD